MPPKGGSKTENNFKSCGSSLQRGTFWNQKFTLQPALDRADPPTLSLISWESVPSAPPLPPRLRCSSFSRSALRHLARRFWNQTCNQEPRTRRESELDLLPNWMLRTTDLASIYIFPGINGRKIQDTSREATINLIIIIIMSIIGSFHRNHITPPV
uniref:Uncharacterized protein n=1 Tax=Anopheles atroparvus TaxID=41427 RepID=A0A182J1Z0_ANOAO